MGSRDTSVVSGVWPLVTKLPSHESAADAPRDRRRHAAELEIERGRVERGFSRLYVGLSLFVAGGASVIFLLGERALREEFGGPLALGTGEGKLRARLRETRRRPVAHRLVRAGVDDEQYVALPDLTAFREIDRGDVAGDAWPHLDALHSLEAAGEFARIRDFA